MVIANFRVLACFLLLAIVAANPSAAITTSEKSTGAPNYSNAEGAVRGNINGLTDAIESGRFRGKRLAGLYQFRGILYSDVMELEQALADLGVAIRLDAKNAEHQLHYAIVLYKQKRDEQALEALARAEKLNPNLTLLHMQRGYIYYYRNQFQQALASFSVALKLNPSDGYTRLWQMIAMYRVHPGQGVKPYGRQQGGRDEQPWPGLILGLYSGEIDEITFLDRLNSPDIPVWQLAEGQFYLGHFYLLKGDRDAAYRCFQQTTALHLVEFVEHHLALRELETRLGELP